MSLCDDLLLEVSKYLRQEIGCLAIDDHHLLVSLPISFADGDAVEVLVHERDGQIVVSDSGTALARLSLAGVDVHADRLVDSLQRKAKGYGVALAEGELVAVGPSQQVTRLIFDVAAAAISTDALNALRSDQGPRTFPVEVVEYLSATVPHVQPRPQLVARTGRTYTLTAGTQYADDAPVTYVHALSSTGSAAGAQANYAIRVFIDLAERLPVQEQRLIVLRGAPEQYAYADVALLQDFAYVGSWTSRGRFVTWLNTPIHERDPEDRLLVSSSQTSF